MSQYLIFVLGWSGAPSPRKVTILQQEWEWANRQIADEFRAAFDGIEVKVVPEVMAPAYDLVVLPYLDDFLHEQPGGVPLYHQLYSEQDSWIMLYGLRHRKTEVMPASELLPYYNTCRRVSYCIRILRRLRLLGVVRRLQRWRLLA